MSRTASLRVLASLVLGIALGSGCGQEVQNTATDEQRLHDSSKFTAEELNAPLSSQAKAGGAQVAAPPIR